MRAINADALKEVIATNVYLVSDCINSKDYGMFWTGGIEKAIDDQPTIEPERKTGFWYALEKGDRGYSAGDFKCSVCGEPNHTWIPKPNYCPNCGAKMMED